MFCTALRFANPALRQIAAAQIAAVKEAGTYKGERVITSKQSALIDVQSSTQPLLNFCANNYLGLAGNPEVIQAAKDALETHGYGLASVRFICGTTDIHKKLEDTMTKFLGTEDTILYPSCFDANGGVFDGPG
ncbi:hypothetical protein TcBrA4_0010960 [Trypanosoma cruzi]|nr:hypothetical protein TcBrA4_0010960 [Trypanosoma cruzi]